MSLVSLNAPTAPVVRHSSGISELDLVLGGGPTPGASVLIGGDPGIGKSTLLLQAAAHMAHSGLRVVYVSGEEAIVQIQGRAERLGLSSAEVRLAAETGLSPIIKGLRTEKPDIVFVDSIQTIWSEAIDAAAGSVSQVRACAQELTRFARRAGCTVFFVGHITKDGQIAGPRVLEHMVDTVLYFEGERDHHFRILRAVKNRFGPTEEIGVFEMSESGLTSASDPSALFLGEQHGESTGRAIVAACEGSRPFLAEVQALAGPKVPGSARRSVVGWDQSRLAMLLAVLQTRCGLDFGCRDIYLSVAGGYRVREPAGDLAAAAALMSSLLDTPIPKGAVFFGEVALSGAIRPAGRAEPRLREAARLGHDRAYASSAASLVRKGMTIHRMSTLSDLVQSFEQTSMGGS